jgi:hypothetical protein
MKYCFCYITQNSPISKDLPSFIKRVFSLCNLPLPEEQTYTAENIRIHIFFQFLVSLISAFFLRRSFVWMRLKLEHERGIRVFHASKSC